ncbi:MAG: hypothetical protein ACYDC1_22340, partial [Limisphaerales bacterium]
MIESTLLGDVAMAFKNSFADHLSRLALWLVIYLGFAPTAWAQLAPPTVAGMAGIFRIDAATGSFADRVGIEDRYQFNGDGTGSYGDDAQFLWWSYRASGSSASLTYQEELGGGTLTCLLKLDFTHPFGGTWGWTSERGNESGTFNVEGGPSIEIHPAVKLTFHVQEGKMYQLQSSSRVVSWTAQGT